MLLFLIGLSQYAIQRITSISSATSTAVFLNSFPLNTYRKQIVQINVKSSSLCTQWDQLEALTKRIREFSTDPNLTTHQLAIHSSFQKHSTRSCHSHCPSNIPPNLKLLHTSTTSLHFLSKIIKNLHQTAATISSLDYQRSRCKQALTGPYRLA